ncbi:lactate utilization protein B [Gaoshiqia sp. Z1-71]|uniref:lactate utilization protein B n=1 Tax=Gaoshiqia hydrogeniformans TaxID=3290090 RepID=UPI003BF92643
MSGHAVKAKQFLKDDSRADWQDQALWVVRKKRDTAATSVSDWENLRERASQIRDNVLSNLDNYLVQFEAEALKNGVQVHWAEDADAFNRIMLNIIHANNGRKIVKSKSMLTEECGLNHFLEKEGIEVVDTDLGERIIQFRNEPPSHIVLPAIHLTKEEVGELFHEKLHTEEGNSDPTYLTAAARAHLREKFLEAEVAITGVNFAVAENGTVVVCTNEGNADMGVHAAPVQIHCVGIEKIIPRTEDLGVFTRLLARSATGQAITTYTSHYRKPKPGGQMHIVIVDNGRSQHLGINTHRNSLKCIRCGACMNTCPVYRRSGGYSYGSVIPGPIGSILAPVRQMKEKQDLPFASSLCGSCSNVCPVKIDIHSQLYQWRQEISEKKLLPKAKSYSMSLVGKVLGSNRIYNFSGRAARWALKNMPRKLIYNRWNTWGQGRELPEVPKMSFKEWYKKNGNEQKGR